MLICRLFLLLEENMGTFCSKSELDSCMLAFTEKMDVGCFVLDKDGYYLYVNDAYCKLTNRCHEFFRGVSIPHLIKKGYLEYSVWEQVMNKQSIISSIITINDLDSNCIYDTITTGIPYFDSKGNIKYVFIIQETLRHLSNKLHKAFYEQKTKDIEIFERRDFIAESPQMKQILTILDVVSKTDATVLINGKSGTGKEIIADYIYKKSNRNTRPFIAVNCAAIPENLMESELFGYEKGAFSGASPSGKKGLIELADGGTLFLDEINSLPVALQAKLLRVIESKQVTRIGSIRSKIIDFRLICSSNENLKMLIEKHRFREDLYYRINVISVLIPPLCERKEDIIPLGLYFLKYYCEKYNCIKVLSNKLLENLCAYPWPGNVRELKNFIERIIITSPESELIIDLSKNQLKEILAEDAESGSSLLFEKERAADPVITESAIMDMTDNKEMSYSKTLKLNSDFSLRKALDDYEKEIIREVMKRSNTMREVAKILKVDVSTIYRKMKKV